MEPQGRNKVLVGLPERLNTAKVELAKLEALVEQLRILYGQRLLLKDSVVVDQMGELLGCPKIEGDKSVDRGNQCPACTGNGSGRFCSAHSWHNPR